MGSTDDFKYLVLRHDKDKLALYLNGTCVELSNSEVRDFGIKLLKEGGPVWDVMSRIIREREHQLSLGFNAEHDDGPCNFNGELSQGAAYLIDPVNNPFPASWSPSWKRQFDTYEDRIEALTIAAALLAAEIERLIRKNGM